MKGGGTTGTIEDEGEKVQKKQSFLPNKGGNFLHVERVKLSLMS